MGHYLFFPLNCKKVSKRNNIGESIFLGKLLKAEFHSVGVKEHLFISTMDGD
jgi:hypothetical protein